MHLEWTGPCLQDLKDAGDFIASKNPQAARRMSERVQEAAEYLLEHPNIGRSGRVPRASELVVSGAPFIVVYRIRLPDARKWP